MQGEDGNIIDGFIPRDKATGGYQYIYSELEPRYAGHKNDVETDHESSLIQTVYKYIQTTGDVEFLNEEVGGVTVADRMMQAVDFLVEHRLSDEYGLLWGATTADWGDVQPEHEWGVYITLPGRAVRYLPAPPQIRTSGFPAYGSSKIGFAVKNE